MYVCICHGVTDKDIKRASKNGATSLSDLQNMTGCATGCGSCATMAIELLESQQRTPASLSFHPSTNQLVPQA